MFITLKEKVRIGRNAMSFMNDSLAGVRPVIEISKSKII